MEVGSRNTTCLRQVNARLLPIAATDNRYALSGKERQTMSRMGMYLAAHESLLDFGARFYDPATAIFLQQDPLAEKYYNISPYAYCANNPVNFVDPDGKALETAWDAICIVYDVGAAVYSHIKGDHIRARGYWTDAGWDTMAALVPFLPAGLSKVGRLDDAVEFTRDLSKTNKSADELGDVSKVKVKNPFGSKGKCDHQAKVEELKSLAEKEIKPNEQVLTEKKIHVEGSNRRPDVQILDENNKTRKVLRQRDIPIDKEIKVEKRSIKD